jgi:hypothetical protein
MVRDAQTAQSEPVDTPTPVSGEADDASLAVGDRIFIRYLDDPRSRAKFYTLTERASDMTHEMACCRYHRHLPSIARGPDGRRSFLVYLRPDVIKRLKVAALDEDRPAYELTEEAVCEWLAARERARKRKG